MTLFQLQIDLYEPYYISLESSWHQEAKNNQSSCVVSNDRHCSHASNFSIGKFLKNVQKFWVLQNQQ